MTISGTKMCSKPIKERELNASDRAILAARKEAFLDAADIAESMTLYTGYDVAQRLRKIFDDHTGRAVDMPTFIVPEGWKLVPIEPTDTMVTLACHVWNKHDGDHADCYKAMLSTAPQPQSKVLLITPFDAVEQCARICEKWSESIDTGIKRNRVVAAAMQGALTCASEIRKLLAKSHKDLP